MRRNKYKLSNYSLLGESRIYRRRLFESSGSVTGSTTVDELISMGILKPDFIETANARLGRQQQRASVSADRSSNLEIARVAIAYFLVNNYGLIPQGAEFGAVKSDSDAKNRKIGFGKKPSEIIVGKVFDAMGIDYNQKVGASGSARYYVEQVFSELEEEGILTNNKDEVSNNAHARYGKVSDPSLPSEFPSGFPQGEDFPTLKEFLEPFMGDQFSFDQGMAVMDDITYYIADPEGLKMIADQCDQEICDLVDQFSAEAMRQEF